MLFAAVLFMLLGPLQVFEVGLVEQGEIVVHDRDIMLRDVADISGIPAHLRNRVANMQITRLPPRGNSFEFNETQLAALIRRRVPALRVRYRGDGQRTVRISTPARSDARKVGAGTKCYVLAVGVADHNIIQQRDVTASTCNQKKIPDTVYFDKRYNVLRAGGDLNAGTFLGNVKVPVGQAVDAGIDLVFRFQQGPVAIERTVRSIQPSKSGENLFVKTIDGAVLSLPYMATGGSAAEYAARNNGE